MDDVAVPVITLDDVVVPVITFVITMDDVAVPVITLDDAVATITMTDDGGAGRTSGATGEPHAPEVSPGIP